MIVTKKYVNRRMVLRGIGSTIALPILDSMVPAFTSLRAAIKPVYRFGAVFVPMGAAMKHWTPTTEGALELSPSLQPLDSIRDRCMVITGLSSNQAHIKDGGPHPRTQAAWLTGSLPRRTEGADIRAGISVDQVLARELGKETQIRSMALGIESNAVLGVCAQGYSCAYQNTVSWLNDTTPIPTEDNPRAVFERLFGASDSTDVVTRRADIRKDRSVLDSVNEELRRFRNGMGPQDRVKIEQYVDAIRDVERRIRIAEKQIDKELPVVDQPMGIPATYEEHTKLMVDLLALSYQTDLTRVSTFMLAREASNRAYPEIGVPDAHHPLSHHADNPEKLVRLSRLNAFHLQMFVYLVEKLRSTSDGDGTLLDNTVLLYGSGMGDPDIHTALNLPTIVVGGSGIDINPDRHLKVKDNTPLANLQLSLMQKVGMQVDSFANSSEALNLVSS